MDEARAKAWRAVGGGLFVAACAALGLASWHGFRTEWDKVASHAAVAGLIAGLIAFFSEQERLDDPEAEAEAEPAYYRALLAVAYLAFAGIGVWALSGADLPDLAVFALTVSGVWVVSHLVGIARSRRRERDSLGL